MTATIDAVMLEARAGALSKRSIKTTAKMAGIRLAIECMDLTTLEGRDSEGRVRSLCAKAIKPAPHLPDVPSVAAVCVYPNLVAVAKDALKGSSVKVASVATAFPSGQSSLEVKLADTQAAIDAGADEIDMVIDRGAFLEGRYQDVFDEIVAVKRVCGQLHLKVILETGELGTYDNVRRASDLALDAGADVIKTSTGKVGTNATFPVALAMCEAIREHARRTGRRAGLKVAGGCRTTKQALTYLVIVKETLGEGWLNPNLFRIGASALLDDLLMQYEKQLTGHYAGPDYFPKDWRFRMTNTIFEYAPAPETTKPAIREQYGLFIDGKWSAPESGRYFETVNPANEVPIAQVAYADERDVERAVRAARRAYDKYWRKMRPADRAKYIYRIARTITERSRELAVLETLDGGKPIKESRDFDIPTSAAHFFYYAGWADKLEWAMRAGEEPRPIGVAGQIVPWNFPLLMAAWKLAPALACGNTVVLKPAETTPLTALALAQIIQEADLPPGVVNVVTGDGATGASVVANNDIDKIAFTGSTEVGKAIQRSLAGKGKRLTLELGGKAAHIVFADAPMDQAIEGIVNGIYFNQGHVCCAGSRLLVEESVHDEIVVRLTERLQTLRLGDPIDKNTDVGAINSRAQLERIQELVRSGVEQGAVLVQQSCALPERGYYFPASFFTNVQMSHRIAREEIFGPVLSILTFRTPDEAIEKANNTPYGLSAGIWTDKGSKNMYIAQHLRAGVVWCNTFNLFDPSSPFGGYRESGFGREGGVHGLYEYLAH